MQVISVDISGTMHTMFVSVISVASLMAIIILTIYGVTAPTMPLSELADTLAKNPGFIAVVAGGAVALYVLLTTVD